MRSLGTPCSDQLVCARYKPLRRRCSSPKQSWPLLSCVADACGPSCSFAMQTGNQQASFAAQAELQTECQKTLLHDGTGSPLASLPPGGRHDFIVSHDVKEVGPHTLVCSTVYTAADGERKYMPQYFKSASHNPLSVRTKVSKSSIAQPSALPYSMTGWMCARARA